MEIVMVITLAIMGIYFFKSADLPKDLKERSAQLEALKIQEAPKAFKMPIPTIKNENITSNNEADKKLLNAEIDKITLIITTLEQQIKANNERNAEIQRTIDAHLITLINLQNKLTELA